MTWFCVWCNTRIEPKDIYARGDCLVHEVITKDKIVHCGPVKQAELKEL